MGASKPPAIPAVVETPVGPVQVERVEPGELGPNDMGDFSWRIGRIRIRADLDAWRARQTYWHEWVHCTLDTAGVGSVADANLVEVICDAIANALVQEERASAGSGASGAGSRPAEGSRRSRRAPTPPRDAACHRRLTGKLSPT